MEFEKLYELHVKQLAKTLNKEEKQAYELWIKTSQGKEDLISIEAIFAATEGIEYPNQSQIDADWNNLASKLEGDTVIPLPANNTGSSYKWLVRIAAVGLLCVSAYFLMLPSKTNSYQTAQNERLEVKLPDGSKVILNSNSSIDYSSKFNKDNRIVSVVGNVYFDVTKNVHPFVVQSRDMKITVLGTKFCVVDYKKEDLSEVMLHEGKIQLELNNNNEYTLLASDRVEFNSKSNTDTKFTTGLTTIPTWTKNELYFDKTPMSDVLVEIQRFYGVEFEGKSLIDKLSYTKHFDEVNLTEVLNSIGLAAGVSFHKLSDTKYKIKAI